MFINFINLFLFDFICIRERPFLPIYVLDSNKNVNFVVLSYLKRGRIGYVVLCANCLFFRICARFVILFICWVLFLNFTP